MRTARQGISIPLAVAVVSVLAILLAGLSALRSSSARRVARLIQGARAATLAQAALAEVASSGRVTAALGAGAGFDALRQSLTGGQVEGGVIYPAPARIPLDPGATRENLAEEGEAVEAVHLSPLYYSTAPGANSGELRLVAAVTVPGPFGPLRQVFAQDYSFVLADSDGNGRAEVLLGGQPLRRHAP